MNGTQEANSPVGRRRVRWCTPILAWLAVCASAVAAGPKWWDEAWPYRVRINCQPDEGDVAWVQVTLANRTTPDGRDLRLVDPDGSLRNFEVIHHDPQRSTLIQFKVPPDERLATWLYYGNGQAPRITTLNPEFDAWQAAWTAWKAGQAERQAALKERDALDAELKRLRADLKRAQQAGADVTPLERRIAKLTQELDALGIPNSSTAPPKPEAWYPRRGVLLRVYRKVKEEHPQTLTALRKLIHNGELEGACFCRGISDGFNRFGPSEHYISEYEGHLKIDEAGEYAFCTASDDGSWVRINDRTVIEWPGTHGWGGSEHGEKNAAVRLKRGVVRVQYYHEEGTGAQMAFLGWKPPNAEQFSGIPADAWLSARPARAAGYEAREKPLLAVPEAGVLNTYWVRDSDDRQATLVEFRSRSQSRAGEIAETRWSFGDGLEAEGEQVRHVYFRTGRPEVMLTVVDEHGNTDSAACRPRIFQVDVKARYFRYGNAGQYAKVAAGYDVERMAQQDLQLCAEFWEYLEKWAEHARAVEAFVRRFPQSPAVPRFATSAAKAYAQPEAYDPQRADAMYTLALDSAQTPRERLELTWRRALVLAWGLEDYDQARELLNDVLDKTKEKPNRPLHRLHRQAVIGMGDVALLSGEYEQAERLYRQAQEMDERNMEQAEMLAKTGSYSYTLEDLLARDEFDWALRVLDHWEDEVPIQKLEGYTFFWRGKVLYVQKPQLLALRYLELAERVTPQAVHVPEAVWLRANCLLALERHEEALAQFQRIRREFTESGFFERAAERIDTCEAKLSPAGAEDTEG